MTYEEVFEKFHWTTKFFEGNCNINIATQVMSPTNYKQYCYDICSILWSACRS